MLARSALAGAGRQFRQPVAEAGQACGRRARRRTRFPIRREPARGHAAGDPAVRREPAAEDRSVVELLTAELHVRQRAAGAALSDPERLRQPLPAGDLRRRDPWRPARSGQHPDGRPRIRTGPRRSCGASGCSRTCSARRRRRRRPMCRRSKENGADGRAALGARADGGASQEPGLRRLPRADGSAGVLAREFRRARASGGRRAMARRSTRAAALPDGSRFEGVAGLRQLLLGHRDDFVRHVHREAPGLRDRPRRRVLRSAGRARNRARRGGATTTAGRRSSSASSGARRSDERGRGAVQPHSTEWQRRSNEEPGE